MLVFNVTFRCRPGMRDAFLNAIRAEGIAEAARAEAGNLQYDWYLPADGGDDLFLVEKYVDADAVASHVRQAHTARLVALKETYVGDMILESYESGETGR